MRGKIIRTETDDIYDNGVETGQKELVINMYKNGMSTEIIAEKAQVSLEMAFRCCEACKIASFNHK